MLISAITTAVQAVLIYYAYSRLTHVEISAMKLVIYSAVYTLFALLFFEASNLINTAYLFAITVFVLAFFNRIKLSSSLIAGVVVYTTIFIVSFIVLIIITTLTLDVKLVNWVHKILASMVVFIVFSSSTFKKMFNFKQVKHPSKAIIPLLGILWIVGFEYIMLYDTNALSRTRAVSIIITLFAFGVVVATVFQSEKRRSEYINIRKKEHDFGNILNTIGALAASKPADLAERIEEYVGAGKVGKAIKTGDSLVDIIIETKFEKAKILGIETELNVDGVVDIGSKTQDVVRVLGILLDNAIEAEAEKIKLLLKARESSLEIRIWDNGKPIKKPKKVFNMGYSTKKGEGRGVGLANVKELAESVDIKEDINGKEFKVCIKLPKKL